MASAFTPHAPLAVLALVLFAPGAHAAGFQIREQSAEGLGRAFSAEAVAADTAAGLWYNPAQAVRLDTQVNAVLSSIDLNADLTDSGSTLLFADGTRVPVSGPAGEDPVPFTLLPALSGVYRLSDTWALGASVNVPFGLEVDYGDEYFGRYDSQGSELVTVDASVHLAAQLSPATSVGGSVHLQYVEADLATALPDPLARGLTQGVPDARSKLEGNNYGVGFSVGLVQDVGKRASFAISYRSEIKHDVSGSVIVEGLAAPFDAGNGRQEATTSITLPDSLRGAVAFQASDRLRISGQVEWVGWSDVDELAVELESGAIDVSPFDYENATNYGLGLDYAHSDALTLRAGVSWDPTPTTDAERSTRVPDSDRTWFTVGGSYSFRGGYRLDLGAAYIDADSAPVRSTRIAFDGQPFAVEVDTRAQLDASAVVASVGLSKRF